MRPDLTAYLGQTITVKIDRPLGSTHPRYPDLVYPVNYGYLPGMLGGDREEQDVYVLGVDRPLREFPAQWLPLCIGPMMRKISSSPRLLAGDSARMRLRRHWAFKSNILLILSAIYHRTE